MDRRKSVVLNAVAYELYAHDGRTKMGEEGHVLISPEEQAIAERVTDRVLSDLKEFDATD